MTHSVLEAHETALQALGGSTTSTELQVGLAAAGSVVVSTLAVEVDGGAQGDRPTRNRAQAVAVGVDRRGSRPRGRGRVGGAQRVPGGVDRDAERGRRAGDRREVVGAVDVARRAPARRDGRGARDQRSAIVVDRDADGSGWVAGDSVEARRRRNRCCGAVQLGEAVVGSVETSTLPWSSTATHSDVVGQEMASTTWRGSLCSRCHVGGVAAGFVLVEMSAVGRADGAQRRPRARDRGEELFGSADDRLQVGDTASGLVEVSTFPPSSAAAQNETLGHDTPLMTVERVDEHRRAPRGCRGGRVRGRRDLRDAAFAPAMQNEVPTQEMPLIRDRPSDAGADHVGVASVGSWVTTTVPPPSPAKQSAVEIHVTD